MIPSYLENWIRIYFEDCRDMCIYPGSSIRTEMKSKLIQAQGSLYGRMADTEDEINPSSATPFPE